MSPTPATYRFDNLPLRCLLSLWIPVVCFFAQFTATQHFDDVFIGVLFVTAIALNGLCFSPPLIGPAFTAIAAAYSQRPAVAASLADQAPYGDDYWDDIRRQEIESRCGFERVMEDSRRFDEECARQNEEVRQSFEDHTRNSFDD